MLTHSFEQITPHVHWLSANSATDRPTLGIITGSRGTLLVDAGNSPAHAHHLLSEMEHRGMTPPTYVMLTHWHWDHIFGASEFHAPLIAHVETKRIVGEMRRWEWSEAAMEDRVAKGIEIRFCHDNILKEIPDRTGLSLRAPDIGFADRLELDLGGVTCEIIHVGGDHAADSSIVHVPQDKVVFLGDTLYLDIYHTPNRYTTQNLFPVMDRVLSLNANYYLEGHNPKPTPRAELVEFTTLLRAVGDAVRSPDQDRLATFAELKNRTDLKLLDEDIEYVDAFLEGLKNP